MQENKSDNLNNKNMTFAERNAKYESDLQSICDGYDAIIEIMEDLVERLELYNDTLRHVYLINPGDLD